MELHNVDCMKYLPTLGNKSVDLVVTDIPYGKASRKSSGLRNLDKGVADKVTFSITDLVNELVRITKGSMYIFCGKEQVSQITHEMIQHGMTTRLCIWEKTNPSPMNGQHLWLSGVECCVFGRFPKETFNERCKNTVFRFPCGRSKVHPTEKPLKLIEYLVLASSNEGDIVIDPFMGSGTTGVACKKNNRNFIGVELHREYYELAKQRIENAC